MRFRIGFALGVVAGVAAAPYLLRLVLKYFDSAVPPLPYVEPDPEWLPIWIGSDDTTSSTSATPPQIKLRYN